MKRLPKVCVIGAGSSGLPVVKALYDRGIPVDCFEKSDRVGGNWVFKNKNGTSSAYRSLHINTSRLRMEFADFPMPEDYPDFAHHSLVAAYFESYVEHFGFRHKIHFETGVRHASRQEDGLWRVELDTGAAAFYDALVVANGHHWDPALPEPGFPGRFDGLAFHSHDYIDPTEPHDLYNKRVVVLGMGNSAMDIACELSNRGIAERVFLSARRGAHVVPHYWFGKPVDQVAALPSWLPFRMKERILERLYRLMVGGVESYGLPKPSHSLLSAHPTISSELLPKIGRGDIVPVPTIETLLGDRVRFVDGRTETVDVIIYCTGYKVSFPFFDSGFISAPGNDLPLYFRTFKPDIPNLCFVGLLQPLGAIMPIAEMQAKWIGDYLLGRYALPLPAEMRAHMAQERRRMFQRYVVSPRHTMQVDFDAYLSACAGERRAGCKRAVKQGEMLPIEPCAHKVTILKEVAA